MGRPKVRPDKATLKARIDNDHTYQQIADDYGVNTGTVGKWTRLYGIAPGVRKGEKHHRALLNSEEARLISQMEGEIKGTELADKFELRRPDVIYDIWRGITWAHCC